MVDAPESEVGLRSLWLTLNEVLQNLDSQVSFLMVLQVELSPSNVTHIFIELLQLESIILCSLLELYAIFCFKALSMRAQLYKHEE